MCYEYWLKGQDIRERSEKTGKRTEKTINLETPPQSGQPARRKRLEVVARKKKMLA